MSTVGWSLMPQEDGTLHGVGARIILTDQCGHKNKAYKTPLFGVRTGDVRPNIVTADLTLLLTH